MLRAVDLEPHGRISGALAPQRCASEATIDSPRPPARSVDDANAGGRSKPLPESLSSTLVAARSRAHADRLTRTAAVPHGAGDESVTISWASCKRVALTRCSDPDAHPHPSRRGPHARARAGPSGNVVRPAQRLSLCRRVCGLGEPVLAHRTRCLGRNPAHDHLGRGPSVRRRAIGSHAVPAARPPYPTRARETPDTRAGTPSARDDPGSRGR